MAAVGIVLVMLTAAIMFLFVYLPLRLFVGVGKLFRRRAGKDQSSSSS